MSDYAWCVSCGKRFSKDDIGGATACPACGTTGVPCSAEQDVKVEINWHELRILGIWASNYAYSIIADNGEDMSIPVRAILWRLQYQHPDLPPLSLHGEINSIKQRSKELGITNVSGHGINPDPLIEVNGLGAIGHSHD